MRYRWPGLGAPLAASTRPIDASRPGRDMVAPRLQVPVTALRRIPDARGALVQGRPLTGTLEMYWVSPPSWSDRRFRRPARPPRRRAVGPDLPGTPKVGGEKT